MTSYSNYFSEHLVQANQNNGQNISLTKPVSTFGWMQNDHADFVMSNVKGSSLSFQQNLALNPYL